MSLVMPCLKRPIVVLPKQYPVSKKYKVLHNNNTMHNTHSRTMNSAKGSVNGSDCLSNQWTNHDSIIRADIYTACARGVGRGI